MGKHQTLIGNQWEPRYKWILLMIWIPLGKSITPNGESVGNSSKNLDEFVNTTTPFHDACLISKMFADEKLYSPICPNGGFFHTALSFFENPVLAPTVPVFWWIIFPLGNPR